MKKSKDTKLKKKIKCFFGYHNWQYRQSRLVDKVRLEKTGQRIYLSNDYYPIRFCPDCFKKQIRQRMDMRIYWSNTSLSKSESRQKKLEDLLDKT